jgi:hypothetical protein
VYDNRTVGLCLPPLCVCGGKTRHFRRPMRTHSRIPNETVTEQHLWHLKRDILHIDTASSVLIKVRPVCSFTIRNPYHSDINGWHLLILLYEHILAKVENLPHIPAQDNSAILSRITPLRNFVCVCVCVCVCICTYVCAYIWLYVRMSMCVCLYVYMRICVCISRFIIVYYSVK